MDHFIATQEWKEKEQASIESFEDPFSQASPWEEPKIGPKAEPKKLPPLRGWEKKIAEKTPTGYAAMRVFLEEFAPITAMPFSIPLVYAKYALPSVRDEFVQLDQEDQTRALLYDALAVTILAKWHDIAKAVRFFYRGMIKKPLKKTAESLGLLKWSREPKVVPAEDAVKNLSEMLGPERIKPYSYREEVKRRLKNKGFGKDEADAVASYMVDKDDAHLLNVVISRKYAGKDMTKAFEKATYWRKGAAYPRKTLKKGLSGELGEPKLREAFYRKHFEKILTEEVYKAKAQPKTIDLIFRAHAKRVFPEVEKITFADVTPHQMDNILLDMLTNKAMSW